MTDATAAKPSRADRLAQQILEARAREAERRKHRQRDPSPGGPWWKQPIGFDPYQTAQWRVTAGADPGYLPRTRMRQGSVGFLIHCAACGVEFDSKGLKFCSACLKLPADERNAMRPSLIAQMCQAPRCENPIPRKARAGTRFCSGACQKRALRASSASNVRDNPGEPTSGIAPNSRDGQDGGSRA